MKHFIIAAPLALLLGSVAVAQSSGDAESAAGGNGSSNATYGTEWSQSIGSTFFSDPERTTLRSNEEITSGWQSLSQEDRDGVIAECERYTAESAGTGADGSDGSATAAGGSGSSDGSTGGSGDAAEVDGTVASAVGYDATAMGSICPTVQGL